MIRKGVILGVVHLLIISSTIAQAYLNHVKGGGQYWEDQIKRRRCCQYGGPRGLCVRWCPESYDQLEAKSGPKYTVDQFGLHCCIPGLYGMCWRWCLNAEDQVEVSEIGGETSGEYQGSRLRCCTWGPRKTCLRWC